MKKSFFLLLLLPLFTHAQKLKSSVDKLTGDTIVATSYQLLGSASNNTLNFSIKKEKDRTLLQLWLTMYNEYLPKVHKGADLSFKLANGSIVTLHATENFESEPKDFSDLRKGVWLSPRYELNDADSKQLQTYPVVLLRFHYNTSYMDFDVDKEDQARIMNAIRVIK